MHDDSEPLGPGNEIYFASKVADGTASPEEARRLLSEFVRQADVGNVSPHMINHLRACIAAFLDGKKALLPATDTGRPVGVLIETLEKAFGLTRASSGQPPIDADTLTMVAVGLLRRRLDKESHQDALANVAADRRQRGLPVSSETEIGKAWAKHKHHALAWVRAARASGLDPSGDAWTPEEMERLRKIYARVKGVVLPGDERNRTGEFEQ
jgi:hypothetical protein